VFGRGWGRVGGVNGGFQDCVHGWEGSAGSWGGGFVNLPEAGFGFAALVVGAGSEHRLAERAVTARTLNNGPAVRTLLHLASELTGDNGIES
jgi:hypothetical protein